MIKHSGKRWSLSCLLVGAAACASAQDYPTRGIRIVLPFAPGGGTDVLARVLSQRWQTSLGQSVVVDNRAGAGGNIGAEIVAKAPPDGYTLLFTTSALAANVTLYPKTGFDPRRNLLAVSHVGNVPALLTVHPSVPAKTVGELVALSKETRGGINFGSNGAGTTSHLAGTLFQQMSGAVMTHIPYKGAAPALNALVGGETAMACPGVNSAAAHLRASKVRGLAVTTKKRSAALPDVPTLDSLYPGFHLANWFVLFVPAGTPPALVTRWHGETLKAMQHPEVQKFMAREGADAVGSTPEEAAAFFAGEVATLGKIIRAAGMKAE
jgi:tripartite-type tricarboxylate transporter receptor subunit TctC